MRLGDARPRRHSDGRRVQRAQQPQRRTARGCTMKRLCSQCPCGPSVEAGMFEHHAAAMGGPYVTSIHHLMRSGDLLLQF